MKKFFFFAMMVLIIPSFTNAADYRYDLSVESGAIRFAPQTFYAGDPVRVYGSIANVGTDDITGYVAFYQGPALIGQPQFISAKAGGASEDVWVDWLPTAGTYNVSLKIIQTTPSDENLSNNEMVSSLLTINNRPQPITNPTVTPGGGTSGNNTSGSNSGSTGSGTTTTTNNSGNSSNSGNTNNTTISGTAGTNSLSTNTQKSNTIQNNNNSDKYKITLEQQQNNSANTNINPADPSANNTTNSQPTSGDGSPKDDNIDYSNSGASVTATILPTEFNTPKKETKKSLNMTFELITISGLFALLLLLIAYMLWKKAQQKIDQIDESLTEDISSNDLKKKDDNTINKSTNISNT